MLAIFFIISITSAAPNPRWKLFKKIVSNYFFNIFIIFMLKSIKFYLVENMFMIEENLKLMEL